MVIKRRQSEPIKLACVRHIGPYQAIGAKFAQLGGWTAQNNLPIDVSYGLYHDDLETTTPTELRSDAAVPWPGRPELPTAENPADGEMHLSTLPGGEYAVTLHTGPYDRLSAAWGDFMRALAEQGYQMAPGVCFEKYLNECQVVGMDRAETELWVPIQA